MLRAFIGTDTEKTRSALNAELARIPKKTQIIRITDAHTPADLAAAQGGGMFGGARAIVLDGVTENPEMKDLLIEMLPMMKESSDSFYLREGKVDAATKRVIQKHAEKVEVFDAAKEKEPATIFAIAAALRKADKKALWVAYQRELAAGKAPEAIHGVLFWAAKQMLLGAHSEKERQRAERAVARLAELPHESRRQGAELEFTLEHFVLTFA